MTQIRVRFNTTPSQTNDAVRVVLDPVGIKRVEPTIERVNGRPIPLAVPTARATPKSLDPTE
jgi:hypothetical protein